MTMLCKNDTGKERVTNLTVILKLSRAWDNGQPAVIHPAAFDY